MQAYLRGLVVAFATIYLIAISGAVNNWVTHIDVLVGTNTNGDLNSLVPGGSAYSIQSESVNGNPQAIAFEYDVDTAGMNLSNGLDVAISSGIPMNPAATFWAWNLTTSSWVNVGTPASDPDFMRTHISANELQDYLDGDTVHFQAQGSTWGPPGGPPQFSIDIDYILPWFKGMPDSSVELGGSSTGSSVLLEEVDSQGVAVPGVQGTLPPYATGATAQWFAALRGHISTSGIDTSGGLVLTEYGYVQSTYDDTYTIIAAKNVSTGQFVRLNASALVNSEGSGAISKFFIDSSSISPFINSANQIELIVFAYVPSFSGSGTPSFLFDHIGVAGAKATQTVGFGIALPSWAESARFTDRVQSGGNGPSSADYVEPSTGVFGHTPNPDIKAFNPESRPDVAYARMYSTRMAYDGIQSPGLPMGWAHSYDYTMASSSPGTWSPVIFRHPNGAEEIFTPTLDQFGSPTGAFNDSGSAKPYYLTGTAGLNPGEWSQLVLTHRDHSKWTFGVPGNISPTPSGEDPPPGAESKLPIGARPPIGGGTGGGGTPPPAPPSAILRLIKIQATVGTPVDFTYDSLDRLSMVKVLNTNLLTVNYGSNGFVSYIRSWLSKEVRYSYATQGGEVYLASVTTVVPQSQPSAPTRWSYGYEVLSGKPFMNAVAAPNAATGSGLASHPIIYDPSSGKVDTFEDANGNERLYDYQGSQTEVTVKDAQGNTDGRWTETFNGLALTTGVFDAFNRQSVFSYGDALNPYKVTSIQDRNGQITEYEYDLRGNISKVKERVGQARELHTRYSYSYAVNANGLLQSVQEGFNLAVPKTASTFTYDSAGRLTQVRTPIPGQSGTNLTQLAKQYSYTSKGNISQIQLIGPSGSMLSYVFNYTNDGTYNQSEMKGRPLTVTNPLGGIQHFRYFNDGTISQQSTTLIDGSTEERTSTFTYDLAGRIASITHPSKTNGAQPGSTDVLSYTEGGDLTEVEHLNEVGGLMRSVSSGRGLEAEVKTTGGNTVPTELEKDALYRPTSFKNGNQQVTQAIYDATGNLNKVETPLGNGDVVTQRDFEGNPTQIVRRSGVTINLVRAPDDARILQVTANGGDTVLYGYDIYNRMTSLQDSSGTTAYTYDDSDNKLTVTYAYTGVPNQVVEYTYNPDGTRNRMYVPSSGAGWSKSYFQYDYLANGQLNFISPPWRPGSAIDYTWRQDGTIKQQRNADLRTIINYNGRGQISTITNLSRSTVSNLLYSKFTLTYDDYGNLATNTAIINQAGSAASANSTTVYGYSANGQLFSEAKDFANPSQQDYSYTYQTDASGYYTSARGTAYPRDTEGKVTSPSWSHLGGNVTSNDRYSNLTYDNYGRTLAVYGPTNTLLLTNTWRGDGLRASRSAQNGTIYYIYDGDFVVAEVQPNGNVESGYAYGLLGLTEEWDKSRNDENSISWDPHGNPVSRHNGLTPWDINVYDVWGRMYSDVLSSNGQAAAQLDSIGAGSQWGSLRDQQTFSAQAALGMSSGKYFDPVSGRNLSYEDRFGNFYTDDGGASDTLYWFESAKYVPLVGAGVYAMESAYEFQNGNNADGWWNVAGAALEIIPAAGEAVQLSRATKVVRLEVARKFRQTGGGATFADDDAAYEIIRKQSNDVRDIVAHTGFREKHIARIKNHVFMDEHILDLYAHLGEPARIGRFESSFEAARAWERLQLGRHTTLDVQWLKHELAESLYMRRYSTGPGPQSYKRAHDAANLRWRSPY